VGGGGVESSHVILKSDLCWLTMAADDWGKDNAHADL
jgi:hypothetical protein